MKCAVVICMLALLAACSTQRVSTEQTDYTKLVSELRERIARYERRMEIYRDSMVMVKGLLEKSSNVADSISHLETSYAKSDAAIRGGRLHHSIENKDSIPSVVKYIFIETEKTDTVFAAKTDTVYKDRTIKTTKEKKRLAGDFFYTSGCMAWLAVVGVGVWFLYKVKKGER